MAVVLLSGGHVLLFFCLVVILLFEEEEQHSSFKTMNALLQVGLQQNKMTQSLQQMCIMAVFYLVLCSTKGQ